MSAGRSGQGVAKVMEEGARYVGGTCKVNYRKVCGKYVHGKLSRGMWEVLAR